MRFDVARLKVTLREGLKIGIGAFTVYIIIAMAIIIL